MEFLGIVAIFVFIWLWYKFKKFRKNKYKFLNIIVYTANFLANNPKELALTVGGVSYAEFLKFVNENPSAVMDLKQIDSSTICFDIIIEGKIYRAIGQNYLMNELSLIAKAL